MAMTTETTTRPEPADTIPHLQAVIEHAIRNAPRTLQTALGPSEIGVACDRCLIDMLAGRPHYRDDAAPWLPTIGNAVHDWLELAIVRHLAATGTDRYIPEGRVTVGQIRGIDITGSSDLFDVHTGTTVDWKIVGQTTLKKVRSGPTITYRNQVHMYGLGMERAGYDVRHVAIWFLPRTAMRLDAGRYWTEPYDPAIADAAIARANAIAAGVDALGIEQVLTAMPPHTGAEFTCTAWPTDSSTAPAAEATRQLAGLIPA